MWSASKTESQIRWWIVKTDLKGQKSEVVATGETDLQGKEIGGRGDWKRSAHQVNTDKTRHKSTTNILNILRRLIEEQSIKSTSSSST